MAFGNDPFPRLAPPIRLVRLAGARPTLKRPISWLLSWLISRLRRAKFELIGRVKDLTGGYGGRVGGVKDGLRRRRACGVSRPAG